MGRGLNPHTLKTPACSPSLPVQAELGLLLTSLPVPPATRRLFFSMVVNCRRRLAKRWEQTPLARLFQLEDEWALFKLEALRVSVRDAIQKRGLLLHDAFLLFDADDVRAPCILHALPPTHQKPPHPLLARPHDSRMIEARAQAAAVMVVVSL